MNGQRSPWLDGMRKIGYPMLREASLFEVQATREDGDCRAWPKKQMETIWMVDRAGIWMGEVKLAYMSLR